MDIRIHIGREIRRCRLSLRISQDELAKRASVSRRYISCIERGTENFSIDVLQRIVDSLGTDFTVQLRQK